MPRRRAAVEADSDHGGGESALGSLLRGHRLRAHLSQVELAHRAGLSVDAVAALERGRRRTPRPYTVRALADALGLDDAQRSALVEAVDGSYAAPAGPTGAIPMPPTPIIGRDDDLAELRRLLTTGGSRLITIVGPTGVGKTRLALEIAHRMSSEFTHGSLLVPLAPVSVPEDVAAAVTEALGVRPSPAGSVAAAVREQAGGRHQLVLIDNCEHLVAAAAEVVRELLEGAPRLSVVLTSREPVVPERERVWPVQPLAVPPDDSTLDHLADYPAAALFLDRARAINPHFSMSVDDVPTLAALLRQLDGLPLALELAAARTNVLTIAELIEDIDASLSVLGAATSSIPGQQRSLQGAIEWSVQLLPDAERTLLARLAVFAGGATREAVEAVCSDDRLPTAGMLDLLGSLNAKSLVAPRAIRGRTRYFLLRTIRQFLIERNDPAAAPTEARHARYYADLAESAPQSLRPVSGPAWLDQLDAEAANLRRAIRWCLVDGGDQTIGIRLAAALWPWWQLRGMYAEGLAWVELASDAAGPQPTPERARVVAGAGMLAFLQCEYDRAQERVEECRRIFDHLGDRAGLAWSEERLGSLHRERAEYDLAAAHHRASRDLYREVGDPAGEGRALSYLGFVEWLRGDLHAAQEFCDASLRMLAGTADQEGLAWALLSRGVVALHDGDVNGATSLLGQSLTLSRNLGYQEGIAWSHNQLGTLARRRGDLDSAYRELATSLEMQRVLGDLWRVASVSDELAAVVVAQGDAVLAARLLGAADGVRRRIGTPIPASERADHDRTEDEARHALGAATYAAERLAGGTTALEDLLPS
jgi:predicted ATPase/DNA-binding XRE family transcriptional regulator